jgi:hypothetical protein
MNRKLARRIVYGIVAIAFLFIAGREMYQAGLTTQSVVLGGGGLILAYMSATGAG